MRFPKDKAQEHCNGCGEPVVYPSFHIIGLVPAIRVDSTGELLCAECQIAFRANAASEQQIDREAKRFISIIRDALIRRTSYPGSAFQMQFQALATTDLEITNSTNHYTITWSQLLIGASSRIQSALDDAIAWVQEHPLTGLIPIKRPGQRQLLVGERWFILFFRSPDAITLLPYQIEQFLFDFLPARAAEDLDWRLWLTPPGSEVQQREFMRDTLRSWMDRQTDPSSLCCDRKFLTLPFDVQMTMFIVYRQP